MSFEMYLWSFRDGLFLRHNPYLVGYGISRKSRRFYAYYSSLYVNVQNLGWPGRKPGACSVDKYRMSFQLPVGAKTGFEKWPVFLRDSISIYRRGRGGDAPARAPARARARARATHARRMPSHDWSHATPMIAACTTHVPRGTHRCSHVCIGPRADSQAAWLSSSLTK